MMIRNQIIKISIRLLSANKAFPAAVSKNAFDYSLKVCYNTGVEHYTNATDKD